MASFREMRDARASRQSKSYVSQSNHVYLANPITAPSEPIPKQVDEEEDRQGAGAPNDGTASMDVDLGKTGSIPTVTPNAKKPETTNSALKGWYADLPPTLTIKRSKRRGRGLWSKEDIKAGTILFSLRPRLHVLSTAHLSSFCANCCLSRPEEGLKKCTVCKAVYYCGAKCQKEDWPLHKLECECSRRWATSAPAPSQIQANEGSTETDAMDTDKNQDEFEDIAIPSEAVRCIARILWKRKKEGSDSIWWKEIDDMQSHRNELPTSMTDSHVYLAHALVRYLGVSGPDDLGKFQIRGVGELVDLISKFTCNAFTLTTPSLTPIGVSVSPLAALINHSCDPNVAIVFPRPESGKLPEGLSEPILQVVAIRDIPANVELFTSYVDVTLPTSQRQKVLKETYNFTCDCSVCKPKSTGDQTDQASGVCLDPREVVNCPKGCGGTCPLPLTVDSVSRCTKCDATLTNVEDVVDAVRIGQEALDKATALQATDPTEALKLTTRTIPLLTHANLAPSSHPLLALQRLHQLLLITTLDLPSTLPSGTQPPDPVLKEAQTRLDNAIRATYASVLGLKELLRVGHPIRAIALTELGKLLAVDEPVPSFGATPTQVPPSPNSLSNSLPSGPARLKLALSTLQQAHSELVIAFGSSTEGGVIGKEVRETIVRLEKELGVWNNGVRDAVRDAVLSKRA